MSDIGIKIGVEGEKEFKKSLREINDSFKVLGSEMTLATSKFDKQEKSIESLTSKNKVLEKQIDEQKNKIKTLTSALDNASDSFGKSDRRTKQWQTQLNNATADLNKMERELSDTEKEIDDMSKAFKDSSKNIDKFSNDIKKSADQVGKVGSAFSRFGGIAKGMGVTLAASVVAIGAGAIKASADLISLGDDFNSAVNHIGASTGATGSELEKLGDVARKVYTNNFGESLEDVAEGVSQVEKITGLMGSKLQKATESGFALRDTFGYDLQESARTANALMENFGLSADKAYNIIAVGAQNGADQNGDLLDTLNEYSAQYSALGLSADQFVKGLITGNEQGVFSIDKVGDAVKEFNIRAKDGSKASLEAFQSLGMNAQEMTQTFAKGGDEASKAFFDVVGAINSMSDPIQKNATAVALFGTQYEDLESTVLPVLTSMKSTAEVTGDALKNISEVKYDNLDLALQGTARSIQGVFLPTVSEMSAGITDAFSELGNNINKADGDMSEISSAIATTIGQIANILIEQLPMFLDMAMNIIIAIASAIIDNLPLIIETATTIVITLFEGLIAALPQIAEGAVQLILTLVNAIIENLPALLEAAIQVILTLALGIAEALPELIPAIVEAVILMVNILIENMPLIMEAAAQIIGGLATGLIEALPMLIEALPEIIKGIIDYLTKELPQIIEMGIEIVVQLAFGLIQAIPSLLMAIPEIIVAILGGLGNIITSVVEIGGNIVRGLWEGICAMGDWIGDNVAGFFGGIIDGAKSLLGIHSPSRVFAGIGENMGLGIGVGFVDAMKGVEGEITDAIPTDFDVKTNTRIDNSVIGNSKNKLETIVNHSGVITVEGINNEGEMVSVVDIIIDKLRAEVRV